MAKEFQLPKEFAEKWVKALRSGDYNQALGVLYSPSQCSYCCLGVAASIQGIAKTSLQDNGELADLMGHEEDCILESFSIPQQLIHGDLVKHLIILNDNEFLNFREIANWEQNVEFI